MTSPDEALFAGLAAIAAGVASYLGAAQRARAIKNRMAEGGDAYLEEQRTYRAYPRLSNPRWYRGIGVFLVVDGILLVLLGWYGRR
jgi:hypothetical protein